MRKVKTTIEIDEVLDEKFRKAVIERKGFHKGVLGEAIEEAIILWVGANPPPEKRSVKPIVKGS
jgi:hypothetical protein